MPLAQPYVSGVFHTGSNIKNLWVKRWRLKATLLLLLLFTGANLSSQYSKRFDSDYDVPKGKIVSLYEEKGKLWIAYIEESTVYENQGSTYAIASYDGYDFYSSDVITLSKSERGSFVSSFTLLRDSLLVLTFQEPQKILAINKNTREVQNLVDEPLRIGHITKYADKLYFVRRSNGINYAAMFDGKKIHRLFDLPDTDTAELMVSKDNFLLKKDYCTAYLYSKEGNVLDTITEKNLEITKKVLELENCIGFYFSSQSQGEDIYGINTEIYTLENDSFSLIQNHLLTGSIRYSFPDSAGNKLYHQASKQDQRFTLDMDSKAIDYPIADEFVEEYPHSIDYKDHVWYISGGDLWLKKNSEHNWVDKLILGYSMRAIQILDNDKLLVATNSPGWFTIDRSSGLTKQLFSTTEKSKVFPSFGIKREDENTFWSTKQGFIVKVKFPMEIVERYELPNWSGNNGFASIKDDMYLAIDRSLYRFDIKTKSAETIPPISEGRIEYIINQGDEYILQARVNGLYQYDVNSKVNTLISADTIHYVSLYLSGSTLYASRRDGIIEAYDLTKNDAYLTDSHPLDRIVFCMAKDQKGRLWMGTDKGIIYQIFADKWEIGNLKLSDQTSSESNRYSIFFDEVFNQMYIGTVNGINKINTDFNHQDITLEIALASFTSYVQDSLQVNFNYQNQTINIPTQNRYLQLKFADKNDISNNNINFEYQINNEGWVSQNSQNTITLANLNGGSHTIKIRGTSDANIRSKNIITIPINVGKYFYEKWWFRLGLFVFLSSIILAWYRRITQEKIRLEKEVANRTQELERDKETIEQQAEALTITDQMKNRFFSNISHELKTPLTLINSPIDQLNRMDLPDDAKYYLSLIESNGELLKDRVGELLEISRLEAGKVALARNNVDLYRVIDVATRVFYSAMADKSIAYNVDIAVPELAIILDKIRLVKLIQNLINNAMKFTPEGGEISAKFEYKEDELFFEIADTGIGIDPIHHGRLFDRFYQVPVENTMANPGTGLGLTMVADYIHLMNGTIVVDSALGQGTVFRANIPIEKSIELQLSEDNHESIIQTAVAQQTVHSIGSDDGRPSILLAEDNAQLRSYIKTLLSPTYRVVDVQNGQEAVDALEDGLSVDIILSDIMMPKLDGVALLQKVRSDDRFSILPFVFLTAKSNQDFKINMFRTGVDDYLTKPFSEAELLARLKSIYANYKSRIKVQSADNLELDNQSGIGTEASVDAESKKQLSEFEAQLQRLILDNLEHPQFGTDFLGEQLGISRRTLQRVLSKEVGLTPKQYIREVQLNHARNRYESNNYSTIKELASSVGFTNQTYFKNLYFERFGKQL